MKTVCIAIALSFACMHLQAQDARKQVDAAKKNEAAAQTGARADAMQQKKRQHQQLKDSTGAAATSRSKKHCSKPKS